MVEVKATDADDPTYGNSARVVYSILEGQPYFSVEPKTGMQSYKLMFISLYIVSRIFQMQQYLLHVSASCL